MMLPMCRSNRKMVFASITKAKKFPSTSFHPPSYHSRAWPSCKSTKRRESFHCPQSYARVMANPIYVGDESLQILRSDRLILEPFHYCRTSSIVGGKKKNKRGDIGINKKEEGSSPLKRSVAIVVESQDPYVDFRASMAEMAMALKLNEWDKLEALLDLYLKVNVEPMHDIIREAFVDLVLEIVSSALQSSSSRNRSPHSLGPFARS